MQHVESSLDRCVLANTRSQWGEDLSLLPTLLAATGGAPGTFVELGAFDGIGGSNTLLLERCFGWYTRARTGVAARAHRVLMTAPLRVAAWL